MAGNGGGGFPAGDHLAVTEGTSFSQLLFAADEAVGFGGRFEYSQRSSSFPADIKPPKMLCFGGYDEQSHGAGEGGVEIGFAAEAAKKPGVTCSGDSNSASSTSSASISALSKSNNKRRNGLCQESVQCASTATTTAVATAAAQRATKKTKSQNPPSAGNGKKKEKLGERIASLQQLVSPFGKTDTASVLHEAMGYIRFLHEQVQVLCSPYLQQQQQHQHQHQQRLPSLPGGGEVGEDARKDLRSRGLCLVPVDYTVHVANTNGADFWSSAMGTAKANHSNVLSSSTKY